MFKLHAILDVWTGGGGWKKQKQKVMTRVGFEPTPPFEDTEDRVLANPTSSGQPEPCALDHSATLPCLLEASGFESLINSPSGHDLQDK